jgi:hypothetical protein
MSQESLPKKERKRRDRLDPRRVRIKGKLLWQVELGSELRDGKRCRLRKTFASREEAQTFAELRKIERTNHGRAGVTLSERLRGEAVEADRLLAPYGDVSILDVIREYVRKRAASSRSQNVENAFNSFLESKTGDGLRPRYLGDLKIRVGRFVDAFKDRKAAEIEPAEIDSYLRSLGVAPLTRKTVAMRLSSFFEFARQRGWSAPIRSLMCRKQR